MDGNPGLSVLKRILVIVDARPSKFVALAEVLRNGISHLMSHSPMSDVRRWDRHRQPPDQSKSPKVGQDLIRPAIWK